MPHFTIEYSANLDDAVDMRALCEKVLETALSTGLFEIGALRVRAVRCEAYAIADRLPENAFVDMSLRMGKGRSAEEKKSAGEAIFEAAASFFEKQLAEPHFALSLEIREIDRDLSWRKNAIHPRLRSAS